MPPRGQSRAVLTPGRRVAEDRLSAFRSTFDGEVIGPDDPTYERARHVWNAMIDRRPALVVRPLGTADVVAAVRFARDEGLEIAVRGGGHNVAGSSTVDDGIVIDLSRMRGTRIEPDRRRTWAQGGALLVDVDREGAPYGLAVPSGVNWDTGVGGLTLGGGYGWLSRMYGLTCDNLRSVELVTATGEVLQVDDDRDPELMWGLRGGGGNFGIVTWFEFDAHPVPSRVHTLDLVFDAANRHDVLGAFRAVAEAAPRSVTAFAGIQEAPRTAGIPADAAGRAVTWIGLVGIDPDIDLAAVAAPMTSAAPPLETIPWAGTFQALQRMTSEAPGARRRRYWKAYYVDDVPDALLAAFAGSDDEAAMRPFYAERELVQQGGAIADRPTDATAFANRSAAFDLLAVGYWDDPAEDDDRMRALRSCAERLAPYSSGVYLNNLGDEGEARVREAFRDARFGRLQALKTRMDPDNVFHRNANIPPAPTAADTGPG